ncbi:MAG: hydrogenase 4 subunit F [Deltaproteobacteria bacterium]|nr:hydrogenase 4 subunit F [Deltaproteobacteria bacterium]
MSNAQMLLYLLLATPFITSLLSFACSFGGKSARGPVNFINIAGLTTLFLIALAVIREVYTKGEVFAAGKWIYLDGLSALFLLVLALLAFITGLYSYGYMKHEVDHGEITVTTLCYYYGFSHLFIFTMLIVITTNNLILMWAGVEATTLASAFLVGIYGQNSSLEAAWKYIIICTVGVAFGLYGTVLVYSNASSAMAAAGLDPADAIFWTEVMQHTSGFDHTLMLIAFVFVFIGFGTKSGIFPLHAWLPDAHSEAPSPTSALLSAVLLKCAFLVILRYYIVINRSIESDMPQMMMLAFGCLSCLVAAFFIVTQHDLKRKLAYHSVQNMGLIAVGMGFGGPIGVFAAMIHVLNHSLAKGLLFCISGNVLLKYGTRDTRVVKGMLKAMPFSAILLAGGALGLGGLPPFNVFISEFLVVLAGIETNNFVLTVVLLLILMMVLGGLVHMVGSTIFGERPEQIAKKELGIMTLLPTGALLIMMLIMGVSIPKPVANIVHTATNIVLDGNSSFAQIKPDTRPIPIQGEVKAIIFEGASTQTSQEF